MASSLYMSPCCPEVEPCQGWQNKAQPGSGRLWYVAQTNSDLGPAVPRHLAAKFPGLCLLKKQARQENQGEFCRDRASCLRAYSSGDKAVDTLSLQIF